MTNSADNTADPRRAAVFYAKGDIDELLNSGEGVPFVPAELVAHLKRTFVVKTMDVVPFGMNYGEAAIAHNSVQIGQQALIAYLEALSKRGQGGDASGGKKEKSDDELHEAEGAGTDPRRPGPRERG